MSEPVILSVEDDEVLATLYANVLGKAGFTVVGATTLAAANEVLRTREVSVVLLDLFLPDGDGRGWLRTLRDDPARAELPVIVIAGSAVADAQVDFYELGVPTIITKPVAPQVLSAAVTAAVNRARTSKPTPAVGRAPQAERPLVVLLAEDDDVVAALVQHRLTREGFTVHRAKDGVAALTVAQTTPLGLVILDIMLPGMDGFELLAQLRKDARTAAVPIIMLTGLGGERDVERALALGADDYVLKPFSPVELTARVNRLVRARS